MRSVVQLLSHMVPLLSKGSAVSIRVHVLWLLRSLLAPLTYNSCAMSARGALLHTWCMHHCSEMSLCVL